MNSKQKGGAYERLICKQLSLWLSHGQREDLLWRSAMSGGRATVGLKSGKKHQVAGDISAVNRLGHKLTDKYFVECKFYKDLALNAFFLFGTGKLAEFWQEASHAAKRHDRLPMLIAKQNRVPSIVITDYRITHSFTELNFVHITCCVSELDTLLADKPETVCK